MIGNYHEKTSMTSVLRCDDSKSIFSKKITSADSKSYKQSAQQEEFIRAYS